MSAIVTAPSPHKDEVAFIPTSRISSSTPYKIIPWHGRRCDDLTGMKFGHFTVIGCSEYEAGTFTNRVKWVVKCVCGRYELRGTRALKTRGSRNPKCNECNRIDALSASRPKLPKKQSNKSRYLESRHSAENQF